jgi:hypothetical protein
MKKHDAFEFSRAGSRQSIYDWDAILSGDVVELEPARTSSARHRRWQPGFT